MTVFGFSSGELSNTDPFSDPVLVAVIERHDPKLANDYRRAVVEIRKLERMPARKRDEDFWGAEHFGRELKSARARAVRIRTRARRLLHALSPAEAEWIM
jgi:hypothetical protein